MSEEQSDESKGKIESMPQEFRTYEYGSEEGDQRRQAFLRLICLAFGRFVKNVVNLFISLMKQLKQFLKDAWRMLKA